MPIRNEGQIDSLADTAPDDSVITHIGHCVGCDMPYGVEFTAGQWRAYRRGAFIQDAMSTLTAEDREFLMTGVCGTCFDNIAVEIEVDDTDYVDLIEQLDALDASAVNPGPVPGQWFETCPRCGHAWLHHDIETFEDPRPSCCVDGCDCKTN